MDTYIDSNNSENPLIINDDIRSFLYETVRWSKFLAILGFIGIGLMIIFGLFASFFIGLVGSDISDSSIGGAAVSSSILAVIYVIMAVIYFFPILYLYRFSINTRKALDNDDQATLNASFEYLKKHYKFIGMLAAILLAIYILIFGFSIIAGITS